MSREHDSDIYVRYRIAENKWNIKNIPWGKAVGIEKVEFWKDDGVEVYAVLSLVLWLMRVDAEELAERIVRLLNADEISRET